MELPNEPRPTNEQYLAAAKRIHVEEGTLEIDEPAIVSQSEGGGAYVQAWVWVHDEDAINEKR